MNEGFAETYARALDDLKFPSEEKDRMAERLAHAADARAQGSGSRSASIAGAGAACAADAGDTSGQSRAYAPRVDRPASAARTATWFRKHPARFAAAAVVAALALGGGGAYATGNLVTLQNVADDLFNGAPAKTEVVESIGHPLGATASDGGITVSADAIIGDAHTYTIVYSISKDDGSAFDDLDTNENGILAGFMFYEQNTTADIDWGGASGSAYFYDADPDDPAIQYVETMSYDATESLAGSVVRSHMKNLMRDDASGFETIAEGTWNLKFDIAYEDSSVALSAAEPFDLYGYDAHIVDASISPISLHLAYQVDRPVAWSDEDRGIPLKDGTSFRGDEASGRENAQDARLFNELLGARATVTLKDGTSFECDANGGGRIDGDTEHPTCTTNIVFDRIIDLDEIESIDIEGTALRMS